MDLANAVTAGVTVVVAIGLAVLVDRAFARRGRVLAAAVVRRDELSPIADTRLQFLRRLVVALILLLGVLLALRQFTDLRAFASTLLASGALLAAVIGFAAQRTLANLVAGVMLAITQPLRIGDRVTAGEESGTVEDVRLNYSVLRTPEGRRIFIPNEKLAAGVLRNDSIVDGVVKPQASFWLPPDGDVQAAFATLGGALGDEAKLAVAEITHEGFRVTAAEPPVPAGERADHEETMRHAGLRALHAAGLLRQE
jgi:small-conductance mechanosensitive channel